MNNFDDLFEQQPQKEAALPEAGGTAGTPQAPMVADP